MPTAGLSQLLDVIILVPFLGRISIGAGYSRARNPRFLIPHFGQKSGFRVRMNEIKSGIPCSGIFVPKMGRRSWSLGRVAMSRLSVKMELAEPQHALLTSMRQNRVSADDVANVMRRARNHRFYFVHAGTKPRFLTKKGHQKSGIPCSGQAAGPCDKCDGTHQSTESPI